MYELEWLAYGDNMSHKRCRRSGATKDPNGPLRRHRMSVLVFGLFCSAVFRASTVRRQCRT
jgi:hypothetical protein